MRHVILLFFFLFAGMIPNSLACDLCRQNQPKVLENITHGPGPSGTIDYVIIWGAVVIVLITLWFSLKYLLKPQEKDPGHIKYMILNQNASAHGRE